jgi:hypothetical protein
MLDCLGQHIWNSRLQHTAAIWHANYFLVPGIWNDEFKPVKSIKHLPGPTDRKWKRGDHLCVWAHENMYCHTKDAENEGGSMIINYHHTAWRAAHAKRGVWFFCGPCC